MKKLFGGNAVTEENSALLGRATWPRVLIAFFAVFFVGSLAGDLITGVPESLYYLSLEPVNEYMSAPGATPEGLLDLIARIGRPDWFTALSLAASGLFGVFALFYCFKIERRTRFGAGLGDSGFMREYCLGVLAGLAMFGAVYAICLASGEAGAPEANGNLKYHMFALSIIGFMIHGAGEELMMRAFFMVSASRCRGGVPAAIAVNSIVFAALHATYSGVTPLAVMNMLLYGVFSSLYFLRRGDVWGVCGIRAAWNAAQGALLGLTYTAQAASGDSLFRTVFSGGVFTGTPYGAESGIAVTIVLSGAITALLPLKNRKRLSPKLAIGGRFVSALPERRDFSHNL